MNSRLSTTSNQPITAEDQWHIVATQLEAENFKLASYDRTLLEELGDLKTKIILDYGCGPGVLGLALKSLGAEVKGFDINPDMREKAGQKIGRENVLAEVGQITVNSFDVVTCNLVLCIVSEEEAGQIIKNIRRVLKPGGVAYIGFCNPKIHSLPESQLDFRFFSGRSYQENHSYRKVKKEGIYEIIENHRPVDWYSKVFYEQGLILLDILLTPEYTMRNQKINDFIIFKLQK